MVQKLALRRGHVGTDLQRFRNECVAAHNFYRASHGTPPLCWSARLAESAQNWAEQLASTTTGSLRYSSVKGFGENLACLWGSELNGQKVTRIWYEEGQYFDYGSTRVTSRTRSFCQVIWQGTRELGAGAAVTENGKQIIVARYFPPLSKKDVARNVKIPRSTRDGAQPLAYDTRWSRLYVGLKEFHEECLSVHNEYRIRHGAAPLHWSAELAWEAQQWAENLARIGELRHNDDDTVGENLAGMTGGELTGREAVDMWYEEIENYDFDCHGYSEDTSNFTQVIWVASENLGVGRAMEGDLCVVVAFYEPPGNVEGSFSNNVLRMGSAVRKRNSKGPKSFIPPPPDLEGFRLECLVTHNYFRARHGSPPLVLNNALTDEAQYWAERLLVTGATEGLDNSRIGISVAVLESKHVSGIKVSELWYKQILCYNFDSPGFSTETLDFSQLVWMSSRKFGVGKATGPEGVTVVVARYEPVGNIDGLFVQNVKRRGHERGSCEPMIFQVEYKYRFRTDSKSTNSVLSWEHEEAPALICDGDVTKASDVDQIDENKNIVPRPDEEEPSSSLTVSDAFTRLVWIDPNSPTLQRKGVAEEAAKEELDDDDDDDADDEGEDEDYAEKVDQDEDGIGEECDVEKMVYEQENRAEGVDCVSEEAYLQTEEPQLEEADLFSDPEDDLYHRVCEVRRSLSLDSEGTEPETQPGNVLSKVAFFETFQRSFERQSPSNSQSSFRRSLIQDKLEELDSTSEPELSREKEEGEERQERPQQEHDEPECQLEFDDLFPAHMEGDEGEIHEDMFEDEAGEDEESLVSVSDAEDIVDFAYYDDRPEDVQDYELEDTYCQTNEFIEEESCTMEIFEFSDEDASHQYSDIIDTEDEPILLTRRVVTPLNSGAAAEFLESQSFEVREAEPQDSIDDSPHDYPDELHDTSEARVEVPQTLFTRTLDPEHCYATTKREEIDIRLRELISKIMLIPVDDRPGGSDELSDFGETTEGQLLQNIFSRTEDGGLEEKRTPIEETCEASQKRIVESEKDFVELLARLQREEVKCDKVDSDAEEGILEPSKETQRPESAEIICATLRDHKSELHDKMERVSSDLGLEPAKYLEEERLDGRAVPENVILAYESQLSLAVDDVEPVTENVEAVEREHKNESASDPERLLERMQSPTQQEEFAQGEIIISDVSESSRSVESYEVAIRDHHQERDRLLDEIGLVPISPDINLAGEEMLEPLPYEHTPILKFRELPEVKEDITAEVRGDVRCELNVKSEESENEYVSLTAETFQDSNETIEKQIPCEAVFRDHDQERALNIEEREFQLELRPEVEDPNEPVEPVLYCTAPKSIPESQLPEISENIAAEVRPEVRSEINIEELFLPYEEVATLQGGKLENAQHVDEMKETMTDKQSHESFYVDDTMTDFSSSFPQHVSNESKNYKPAEELKVAEAKLDNVVVSKVEPEEADIDRRASLFEEKNSFVDSITLKEFSERLHVAGETLNVDPTTLTEGVEIDEQTVDEKQGVQFTEEDSTVDYVMTDIPLSSGHIAGECTQNESVEKINEEEYGEFKKPTSLFIEEDSMVNALLPDTMSSPKQVSGESKNVESFEEILEEFEPSEESKRTSIFLGDAVTLDEVRTDIQSSPKHLAMESRDVEPYQEIIEVTDEENKQASRIVEEVPNVETVRTDRPSSPRHLIMESKELETFEKTDDENTFESKRASLFMEETTIVKEATSHASSFPKHIAGEINNEESFEEVDEIATKESNRVSQIVEETMTVGEITTNTKSPPTHLAGERTQNESIDLILEEQCFEGKKRASLFFEEDSSVKEVGASAISSPNQVAGEGKNVENFNEINEEPNEERKRASLFYEEVINEDEILTCTSFLPKQTAEDISNEEIFDKIEQDDTQESKRASLFIEEGVTVDEMITNTSSSRTHGLAGESVNTETFEDVETISDEEKKQTSVFLEEDVFADEMTPARTSFAIHTPREDVCIPLVKKTHEKEDEQDLEHADVWEDDIEVKFGHTELTCLEQNSHIAGEFLDSGMVEATDDDEPPESVYVEEFEEFENSYGIKSFVEPAEIENIAGEMANVANDAEAFEEDARIEESLGYDENHEIVISTDILGTPLNSLHIAGTLSNVEPKEESCEEEKTEKEAFAEKFHELKAHESTVVLKSPQSLLSIAAAAIEHKIDSAQQDSTEEVTMETGLKKQDSKEEIGEKALLSEQSPTMFEDTIGTTDAMVMETETKVPIILVNIAAEVSGNEDDNLVFVKKDSEVETETYEYPEEVAMEYHPDDQEITVSQEVAEVSLSELVLEDENLGFTENELNKDSEEETETYEYSEEAATGYVPNGEEISVSHEVAEVSVSELVLEDENLDFAENELKKDSEVETKTYEYPEEVAMEYHPDDQEIAISQEVAEVSLSELVLEDENLVFAENDLNKDSEVETETYEYPEEAATGYVPNDEEIPVSHEVAEVSLSELVLEDENLDFAENDLKKDSEVETETYEYPEEEAMEYHPDDQEIPVSHEVVEVSLSELVLEDENLDFAENDLKKDSEVETETYEYPEEAAMEYHPDNQEIPVSHEMAEVSLSELVLGDENLVFAENELKKDSEVETETYEYPEEAGTGYVPNNEEIPVSHEVAEVSLSELVLEDENLVFAENELKEDSEVETETHEYPEESAMDYLPDDQVISESHEVSEISVSELLEDKNLVFVENELKKDSEVETEKYEYPDEASMEYLPDDQIISESHEVAEVFVSEHILEQKAKVKQRETVEAFEGSEEGSISELLSESSSSPLRVSDELKDLQDYETINEEYDIETYHSINYEEGDTVSEKSISKCLPPLFITEELVLQEEREDNIEEKKVQDHDNLEERSQGPESPYVSGQSLETATELSDVGFTDYSVKEELNEREFAEEFMDIESVIVETSRKDHLSPQKNEKGVDLLGKVNAQKPEERGNVTIEQSTIESEPTVSAVSREQKEGKIFDYSWQMENKTEEPIVEKAGKREVAKAKKTTTDSENEGTFTEHGLMLPKDEESFSVSQSESLIVSEQGRQMKILHEKEEKVDVFSTRTKQSISHVAAESTSRTLEYNFESHSACIFRQVATSDKLSESILDKETKDQELEKYEKEFSEEETEVRLLKNEVLECKVAEQQLPTSLGNPHAIVERETTLVKTLVTRSPSKDDQEEVLLREDRLTAVLKDDEAMLEQESAVEHFEEEIDVMRMDEALSEEEFRGEGAESIDREQSRPSRSDSVEEDDTCNESEAGVEDKRNLNEAEKDDAGNFQGAAEDVVYESDANSLMKTSVLDEEVEVKVFEEGGSLVEENREIVDKNETRTETPVFEEELDVSALPTEKDIIYAECTEEDSPVDRSAVFEEEVEVSALPDELIEELEVESFAEREEEDVDRTAVYEEELEITACKTQLEQEIQERESDNQVPKVEEGCEITGSQVHEERTNEENLMHEHEDSLTNESEAGERLLEKEDIGEKSDDEGTLENLKIRKTRKQPLDLSQVDFYDEDESATATRYYVEFSSTESLEPSYEEVDEDEAPFSETYVRQGEPLEENLEEFILVRYGDEFESSGEEDISDHREIYVIPEEENDIENHNIAETTTDEAHAKRPAPETLYEDEFENMGLGEIRESPEFDIDDSDELDEEEQRQLEEYERLESFVILEEKLSQVESDEDGNGDIPLEEDDENVFYSDVHSSGEETLHEDELGETLTTGSLRQTAAFTEKDEAPLGRDCTQMEEQDCGEQQETLQECSPETKEPVTMTGFSDSQEPVKVSPDDPGTTKDSEIEIVTEAPEDNKENFELRNTKEEKAEHSLSSDSSGEQCMSAEGSVSSTTSLDLEGLDSFEQECLLQHNLYRRQHKVKPLKWSEELAEGAKKWAEHLASMKSLESFEGKEVGENITSMQGKELNGCETADLWYKEAMDYNFEDPAFNAKCGRFTQVVWASSREFGVAKCIAEDGTEYIVARYKPAGNILGEFKDNVKPPRDTLKRRRSSVRRRSKSGAHLTPAEKEKFKTECVVSHNYYRTFHDAPPLRWSPLLAAEAQNYAERLAKTDSLTHSGQKDRGENLAFTWDIPLSAREAIDMWYDEVQDYDFENPGFTYDTGHFTQLIWVGTEEFGMGMTVAPDGKNIVVGRYFPPGNIVGQFKENVRPREIEAIP
ncbi:titin-like isoform X2 [Montipora foliosa]|uniref:titin-like isoform X2 n=1 Tax=Montipora foliosa TaxID=591990 RepID=UPI0035F10027